MTFTPSCLLFVLFRPCLGEAAAAEHPHRPGTVLQGPQQKGKEQTQNDFLESIVLP